MQQRFQELLLSRYRKIFHPQKTGRAFGYWNTWVLGKEYYELSKEVSNGSASNQQLIDLLAKKLNLNNWQEQENLLRSVCMCSRFDHSVSAFEQHYRTLLSELECTDIADWDNTAIERLIYIFIVEGLFHAALLLREKYEKKVLTSGRADQKLAVLFQNGEFEAASRLLHAPSSSFAVRCISLRAYHTYKRSIDAALGSENSQPKNVYEQYLKSRPIYIIGPSDNQCPVSIPEDCALVRFAYMGKERLSGCYANKQTTISYYNGTHADRVSDMADTSFLDELQFAVLKYKPLTHDWCRRLDSRHLRVAPIELAVMQHGVSLNMLQIVLIDLLQFGKLDITVLNNNLYLNRVYEAGYASIEVQKAQGDYDFAAQFAKHDVFCNFRFTKALHDRGFFRADARLEAIMSMTAEQFADAMQKEYGHQNYLIGGTA